MLSRLPYPSFAPGTVADDRRPTLDSSPQFSHDWVTGCDTSS